jgi:hypothetical protein
MQDPPSQPQLPLNQLYSSPSEIYSHEQLQATPPVQEITRPFSLSQNSAFYPDRRQVLWRTILFVVCFAVSLLCFPLLFVLNFLSHGSFVEAGDTVPLALMLAMTAFIGQFTWNFFSSQLPRAHLPLLVLNREGITVGRMFTLSGSFISWAEIESIYLYTYTDAFIQYRYLCIRPRNIQQYLSRFPRLERFYRSFSRRRGTPIAVPEDLLEKSIEEILHQLHSTYASELSYYQIQLRF